MAIHTEAQIQVEGGFAKKIENSSMGMILDVLQKYQYQYPIKSIIRELTSNALDAITEREIAKSILSGKSKVEDHFANITGDIYKDSVFNPQYYNLSYLSEDPQVYITYYEGSPTEKDYIKIEDNGVGLGGNRLEKYFNLGYSTKRLNKAALGKFGIGNKSPLSLVPFYTVESRYNGQLFRFNVYSGKVESLIPRFNMDTEKENLSMVFENGYRLYYEQTDKPNGVSITIEAKKHHRSQYVEAVKSQLLYFDRIEMKILRFDGTTERIYYKADIFYEDNHIILSDNSYWSKPHLLINRVNYGFIDFTELELEQKMGNIGIKVEPELLDINPSRESVLWTEKTKQIVQEKFKEVVKMATGLVQEELNEQDFVRWVNICYQISSRYQYSTQDTVLTRLAHIIDISEVKPHFPGNPLIVFSPSEIFKGFSCRVVKMSSVLKAGKRINKIVREDLDRGIGSHRHLPIVLIDERTSVRKDKYLLSLYPDGFLAIRPPIWLSTSVSTELKDIPYTQTEKDMAAAVWEQLGKSKSPIRYEDVQVPEDFQATEEEEEEQILSPEDASQAELARLSHEERRKHLGKVLVQTPRLIRSYQNLSKLFEWQHLEVPVQEIGEWDEEEIYYGNEQDAELFHIAALMAKNKKERINYTFRDEPQIRQYQYRTGKEIKDYGCYMEEAIRCLYFFDNPALKLIKVAQTSNKLYRDFKHIKKFFLDIQNNTITMSNVLVKWNTARQIKPLLHHLNFLYNFSIIPEKQQQFRKLLDYVNLYYGKVDSYKSRNYMEDNVYNDMVSHIDKVQKFQLFVGQCQDAEQIAQVAKEMWGTEEIKDGHALDMQVWNEFKELLDWASPISSMFNAVAPLTGIREAYISQDAEDPERREEVQLSDELRQELLSYMQWKNVS